MGILQEIRTDIFKEDGNLAPTLLKLQFLASRLDSVPLEEWVKHESEGYPIDAIVPDYRKITVHYQGKFVGFGNLISNYPIPPVIIHKHVGEKWLTHEQRDSIAGIDAMILSRHEGDWQLSDASNLIPKLQGKVFPNLNCISIVGIIPAESFSVIRHNVRSRILGLTLKLEKIPNVTSISIDTSNTSIESEDKQAVTNIINQTILGDGNTITNTGNNASIENFQRKIKNAGFPLEVNQINELISIIQDNKNQGQGVEQTKNKVKSWLVEKFGNATADKVTNEVVDIAVKLFFQS